MVYFHVWKYAHASARIRCVAAPSRCMAPPYAQVMRYRCTQASLHSASACAQQCNSSAAPFVKPHLRAYCGWRRCFTHVWALSTSIFTLVAPCKHGLLSRLEVCTCVSSNPLRCSSFSLYGSAICPGHAISLYASKLAQRFRMTPTHVHSSFTEF